MDIDKITKALSSATDLLGVVSPHLLAAVKAGTLVVEVYNDFQAARSEIEQFIAQDKVTKADIDRLDDSIQARRARIKALLANPTG